MKRMLGYCIIAVIVFMFSHDALAERCEYYQWKPLPCKAAPKPEPVRQVERVERGEQIVLEGVTFDTGSAKIRPESFAVLDRNVRKINNAEEGLKILVVGYTDDRGSDAYNQKLSERRAKSVEQYFLAKGVPAFRVKAKGLGEANPIADNTTTEGRAQNRRIELEAY